MDVSTIAQFEFFRVFIVLATAGLVLFLGSFVWLTRGRVFKDPLGRAFTLADLFGLVQTVPLLIATFHHLSGTANTVAGWTWIMCIGMAGLASVYLTYVLWRENYGIEKRESK